jgi:hypothetical protein
MSDIITVIKNHQFDQTQIRNYIELNEFEVINHACIIAIGINDDIFLRKILDETRVIRNEFQKKLFPLRMSYRDNPNYFDKGLIDQIEIKINLIESNIKNLLFVMALQKKTQFVFTLSEYIFLKKDDIINLCDITTNTDNHEMKTWLQSGYGFHLINN